MKMPMITHLQFLLLSALRHQSKTGRELREDLKKVSIKKSGPAFYQLMARMEDGALVEGWYSQTIIEGQIIKERNYKITPKGRRSLAECRAFYEECPDLGIAGEATHAT